MSARRGLARWFPVAENANLANAITLTSVALGASGLLFSARGRPLAALLCGVLAIPCDTLDGMVARRRGTSGPFGAQLDTLADATSFCLLPPLIGHALAVPAWGAPFQIAYALAGVTRLARFGQIGMGSSLDGRPVFEGVPTPYAAGCFYLAAAAAVWLGPPRQGALLAVFYALAALAMVAGLPFPKSGLHTRAMWVAVPVAVVALVARLR